MYTYSFEKLQVWKDAKELATCNYALTSNFPAEKKIGLISQLRRASVSIASNIAEGSARKRAKDQARFTVIAFNLAIEILNQIIISFELGYISELEYIEFREQIEKVTNKLDALRKVQINK